MSQPTPENQQNPDTQPFRPQSYELAPEFSTPQPDAPAPGHPHPGPPPQGYPPPAYAAPGAGHAPGAAPYGQPAGFPGAQGGAFPNPATPAGGVAAPAQRRRGKGWLIALSLVAVVLLGCCGVGAAVIAPIMGEYPADIDAPSRAGGLEKIDNPQIDKLGEQVGASLKGKGGVDRTVVGLYARGGDQGRWVLMVGAAGLILRPGTEITAAFKGMSDSGVQVTDVKGYDAGALGGEVRCGAGVLATVPIAVCTWGDHGTIGLGIFFNQSVADSAVQLLKMRADMVTRS